MTAPQAFFRIGVSIEGEQVVDRVLQGIEDRARDLTPAWPFVVAEFQAIMARAFATEGASTDAGAWKPLAKRTQKEREKQGFPPAHPILQRTGRLRAALTEGTGAFVRTRPQSMQYLLASEPDSVASFPYHQSRRPRAHLPRRAPVSFTADNRTAVVHPLRLHLTGRDPSAPRRSQGVPR